MSDINYDFNKLKKINPDFRNDEDIIDGATKKDLESEVMARQNEAAEEADSDRSFGDVGENIKNYIKEIDHFQKALTGRTPERIEEETGIAKEKMFPDDKTILYVGDPWQRMAREINDPRLTIIDYEYGDVVSFIDNEDIFRKIIKGVGGNLLSNLKNTMLNIKEHKEWLEKFYGLVKKANNLSNSAKEIKELVAREEYKKASNAWGEARQFLEDKYSQEKEVAIAEEEKNGEPGDMSDYDEFSQLRVSAWYDCVYGERGFRDVSDWHNIIAPKLQNIIKKQEKEQRHKLSEDEKEEIINKNKKRLIEEIRLKKDANNANVVEAMFPDLPFRDDSFDRFVASWSISAHIFQELNEQEFDYCWNEIIRVLKNGGEAYIFPLDYCNGNQDIMVDSLEKMAEKLNFEYKLLYSNEEEIDSREDNIKYAHTLWIKKL